MGRRVPPGARPSHGTALSGRRTGGSASLADARARLYAAPDGAWGIVALALGAVVAAAAGFAARDEMIVQPESGIGYGLGIAGLGAMSLLLLYSLRKRVRFMARWGALRHWFGVHMALGILGPLAILFHANFHARSVNASVALGAMLAVSGSGFFGRFLYTRIHYGLFGRRQTLREMRDRLHESGERMRAELAGLPQAAACVHAFESAALAVRPGPLRALVRLPTLAWSERAAYRAARRILLASARAPAGAAPRARAAERAADAAVRVRQHLRAVRRVAEFTFWERLFGLWHAIHLPLCIVLFAAAAVHVIAVHVY